MNAGTEPVVNGILRFIGEVLERYPSRIPGTEDCLRAAGDIAAAFRRHCSAVREERFDMRPGSLWHMGRIVSAVYLLSLALFAAGGGFVWASAAMNMLALVYAIIHYIRYGHTFDFLFRRKEGCNVTAVLEPNEPAERQILLAAHHDSAYVFGFLARFPRLAGIRFVLAMAAYLLETVLCLLAAVGAVRSGLPAVAALTAGALFTLPLFFFITGKRSPGASDDLIGVALLLGLASRFTGHPLERTRLLFLSADGEECGQCGSQRFVKAHASELRALPTRVINIDSIYSAADLSLMKSDGQGFIPLSARMAEECSEIASALGYDAPVRPYPFGGGGTDAASFAKAGIEAVSVIAMPLSLLHGRHIYHTMNDTLDHIEPEAVAATYEIITGFIIKDDEKQG
jgi:aminopeptidase YwaD